jgi:cellobiose-specific phosphotransferase system component IIA
VRATLTADPQQAAQAREHATQAVAHAKNVSVENARREVQQYEQQYRQAVDQAKQ